MVAPLSPCWMAEGWVGGRWIQFCLVGLAGGNGGLHRVVDFKDYFLGSVGTVLRLVSALHNREGLHDVTDSITGSGEVLGQFSELLGSLVVDGTFSDSGRLPGAFLGGREVKMEESGIQLAAEQKAARFIPSERRSIAAAVFGKGF